MHCFELELINDEAGIGLVVRPRVGGLLARVRGPRPARRPAAFARVPTLGRRRRARVARRRAVGCSADVEIERLGERIDAPLRGRDTHRAVRVPNVRGLPQPESQQQTQKKPKCLLACNP